MKKLALFVLAAAAFGVAASDYNSSFNAWISDGCYEQADSVLRLWESQSPDDPELYPARFNYFMNRARSSVLVLNGADGVGEDELVFRDSAGTVAGSIGSGSVWNDSLFALAMQTIDKGIEAYPLRLDFRLGKAAAAELCSSWGDVAGTVEGVLELTGRKGTRWCWTGGGELGDSAKEMVADAAFDYLRRLYSSDDAEALGLVGPLGDKILKVFPKDDRTLNLMGAASYDRGDAKSALSYFDRAAKAAPDDAVPLCNMAYMHYEQGDTSKALKLCRKVIAGAEFDEESKRFASDLERKITTPVKAMRPYDYFFRWLPSMAAQIPADDGERYMSVPGVLNTKVPEMNGLTSPFEDSVITVEAVECDGLTVYVWTFPEPKMPPLCLYVAFVPQNGRFRVYTLELSLEDMWVLGGMGGTAHSNYGVVERPADASGFAGILKAAGIISGVAEPEASFDPGSAEASGEVSADE